MHARRNRALRGLLTGLIALALGLIGLILFYRLWERPPALAETPPLLRRTQRAPTVEDLIPALAGDDLPEGEQIPTARQDGVYTLLLVGNDDGNGNTDTLILCRLDTARHQMDFVSIPRDTLINSPWEVRKINAVYWGSRLNGGDGIAALKRQIARLTGFEPDCCAVMDLDLFVQAVDLIDGVYFDVPMDMDYEDPEQDLRIHLKKGYQLLNGSQAMGLCRFRSGYVTGDLGRIEMQQQFLSACLSQFLSRGTLPHAAELVQLLSDRMDTDLSPANLAFLLRQALQCKSEDVRFAIAPSHPEIIAGYSYAVLDLNDWLQLVNDYLNPFDAPIVPSDIDIVYRLGDSFVGTLGLRDEEYYSRGRQTAAAQESDAAPETHDTGGSPSIISVEP